MKFLAVPQFTQRKQADVLVLPFWKGKERAEQAIDVSLSDFPIPMILDTGDFKGKEGEVLFFYMEGQPEKRMALLGLGSKEKMEMEGLRRCYGNLTKACLNRKLTSINVLVPQHLSLDHELVIVGMAEGLLLPNYAIDRMRHPEGEETETCLLQKISWIASSRDVLSLVEKTFAICTGVYYARDLVNGNADEVTPQYLVACAKTLSKDYSPIKTTIFDKGRLEKEKMGLLLAVNRGSSRDPALIIMEYKGKPKSQDHTVVIGKGITYDTGGLNIKTSGMESMKCDMGGAAVCFGTLLAACLLKLKVNLTVVIPTTENCVDANSFKPGDVYSSYAGKNVEVTNTDAEGRLILADALAYASKKLKPTRLIDFATLTGAIEIALGPEATGLMSNNDSLSEALILAGNKTFERVWRMPLFEEYKERLKSDIADLKSWNGRSASSCVAATFLQFFINEQIPWAHLDIASTAFLTETRKYLPKYATGVGVRLMIEFLETIQKKPSV
jgi:leucyl aminopeptidase